eukprot:TRINITY_DN9244_c0_g1_i7.p4 TRINITY_DN9244_c0_g1~~TRINITY_DN9244_c0_g1_i7.p4  ORF type:complete len:152 (-),score=21.38 TRINITY_DN9244_c0_g1_i7:553-1008(-)
MNFILSYVFFFLNDTATTEIYTILFVGSVRCVQETGTWASKNYCTLVGHQSGISCIDVVKNGEIVASGSLDQSVRIWKGSEGECFECLQVLQHQAGLLELNFIYDAQFLISKGQDGNRVLQHIDTAMNANCKGLNGNQLTSSFPQRFALHK